MNSASDIKRINSANIIRLLHKNRLASKNEIAEYLGLSSVTAHNIINDLQAVGLCTPSGESVSRGGRNAVLYKIDGGFGCIVSQLLHRQDIITTVYDVSLNRLFQSTVPNAMTKPNHTIEVMCKEIKKAINHQNGKRVMGVGVSLPGRSSLDGIILHIPGYAAWGHIPLKSIIESNVSLPVYIDNDINALALSAKWNGLSDNFSTSVYISVEEGFGVGILLDDQIFRGSNGYGCEIGHTTIDYTGPRCSCGNKGCLETFIKSAKIVSRFNKTCKQLNLPRVNDMPQAIALTKTHGSKELYEVFQKSVQLVAISIENIARNFDPQAVIIRCSWLNAFPELFAECRDLIFSKCGWLKQDKFSVMLDNDSDIFLSSPACLFLENYFASGAYFEE